MNIIWKPGDPGLPSLLDGEAAEHKNAGMNPAFFLKQR